LAEIEARARPKPRIESLSDLIFGLALSVGAITLVGNVDSITTAADLETDVTVFGFSFLILIGVWMRYTRITSVLPLENRWTISLNTALLFTVSLEPFLFNILEIDTKLDPNIASQAYAADLGVMMAVLGVFTLVLTREERKLIPKDSIREFKIEGITLLVAATLFFISIHPIFWNNLGPYGLRWRFYLWIIPFAMSSIRRRTKSVIAALKKG
jgi:uncharacterized membrane protein